MVASSGSAGLDFSTGAVISICANAILKAVRKLTSAPWANMAAPSGVVLHSAQRCFYSTPIPFPARPSRIAGSMDGPAPMAP